MSNTTWNLSVYTYVLYESTAFQATATRVRKIRLSTEEIVEFGGERENELAFLDGGMSVALPPAAGGKHEEDTHTRRRRKRERESSLELIRYKPRKVGG